MAQMKQLPLRALVLAGIFLAVTACSAGAPSRLPASTARAEAASSACRPPPLDQRLFLRGAMTTWTLREDLAFQYVCDAYLLNVDLHGRYAFRITDARFSGGINFGTDGAAATLQPGVAIALHAAAEHGSGNLSFEFNGAHTLHLQFVDNTPQLTIGAKSFDDPATARVDDPVAQSLRFDSRAPSDKSPFGALPSGSAVDFTLHAAHGVDAVTLVVEKRRLEGPQEVLEYEATARVPLARTAADDRDDWRGSYRFDALGVYGYYFLVEIGGHEYVYGNNADPIYWTRELGSNGRGTVTRLGDTRRIRRFRQTIHRDDFQAPPWARDIVYYYIFPERFRNGNVHNDPKPGPRTFHDRSLEVHKDWLEKPFLPHSGDGSNDLYGNDFYGGDLAGITQKLDYIADLGANTLYLTPIFEAASNHKYDTADYRRIDPHFGSNAEFEQLARAAKQHGMRIVLDTSLNHSGSDSIYFDRYAKYPGIGAFEGGQIHPESPYADWYRFDPNGRDPDHQYHGWAGAQDLPELNKSSPGYRDFAYRGDDSIMKLWLDRGASGWRMDVAPWIPDDFWREWRGAVKGHRADALTVCETQFESSKFLLGDEFDATMNYVFRNAVEAYANGGDARMIYRNIELLRETYPPQAFFAMMNLLSTHDTARALFDFGYRDAGAPTAQIALAKQRLRLAVFFQMIFPGAPTVFYADEVGATGGDDPFNRVTYPWADRGGQPDMALHDAFRRLIHLRRDNAVLRHGSIEAPLYIDAHVIVLLRHDGKHWAVTALNNDDAKHDIAIEVPTELRDAAFADAPTPGGTLRARGTRLEFSVPALDGRVLLNETR
jgi:cyclomaltodextrinase